MWTSCHSLRLEKLQFHANAKRINWSLYVSTIQTSVQSALFVLLEHSINHGNLVSFGMSQQEGLIGVYQLEHSRTKFWHVAFQLICQKGARGRGDDQNSDEFSWKVVAQTGAGVFKRFTSAFFWLACHERWQNRVMKVRMSTFQRQKFCMTISKTCDRRCWITMAGYWTVRIASVGSEENGNAIFLVP